jgi:hypothetical protein
MDYRDEQKFTEEQKLRSHNAIVLLLQLLLILVMLLVLQVLKKDRKALIEIALRGVGWT